MTLAARGRRGATGVRLDAAAGTRQALACLALALVLGLLSLRGANPWLLLVGLAVLTALIVSYLLPGRTVPVALTLQVPPRAVVGQPVRQPLRLRNTGRRSSPPLRLHLHTDGLPCARVAAPALGPGGEAELLLTHPAQQRGVHRRQVLKLEAVTPFGLTRRRATLESHEPLVVHPAPAVPAVLVTPGQGEAPTGRPARTGHDLHGLREWRQGDTRRQVHWRATARRGEPVVVVPELTREPRVAIVVLGGPGEPDWEPLLSVAAWTAVEAARSGSPVRLVAGGVPDLLGRDPTAVLDWFAALVEAPPPGPAALAAARAWTGDGLLAVASTRPADAWPAGLASGGAVHLTGTGQVNRA